MDSTRFMTVGSREVLPLAVWLFGWPPGCCLQTHRPFCATASALRHWPTRPRGLTEFFDDYWIRRGDGPPSCASTVPKHSRVFGSS
ncbi:hypothetical protein HDK64DRAFT_283569 [Phyllosticta capitalensis]